MSDTENGIRSAATKAEGSIVERLIAAESSNFAVSRNVLGNTVDLAETVDNAYQRLSDLWRVPEQNDVSHSAIAAVSIHLLLVSSRRQFLTGIAAVMKAYRGDSLLHLTGFGSVRVC